MYRGLYKLVPPQGCERWLINPQEYYSNKYLINHSEIGLINQLNANELGHHLVVR